eukprot:jgi/Mesen1/6183/ME000032S05474
MQSAAGNTWGSRVILILGRASIARSPTGQLSGRAFTSACKEAHYEAGDAGGGALLKGLRELGIHLKGARERLAHAQGQFVLAKEEVQVYGRDIWISMGGHLAGKKWSPGLPPLARTVGAVTWSCSKSQVVPRGLAVILGEATLRCRSPAIAEQMHGNPLLSSQATGQKYPLVELALAAFESFILALRSLYLLFLFTPVIITSPFANSMGRKFRKQWLELLHLTLARAGAAFIKWGQWAATRPDLFPKDMCQELSKLHSKAPAHSFAFTKKSIEGAFGRRIDDIFDDFEEEPVASGSIAQIHRAVLRRRYPGQVMAKPQLVAVKVRHPGVSDVIRRDFVIMNWCARVSSLLPGLRWLRLEDSVQQFATFMMAQVDNFIHADLHPGNILVRMHRGGQPSNPKHLFKAHPHVVLLDVGMTAELSARDRRNMLEFFKAIAKKDGRRTAECTLRFTLKQDCPDPAAFIDAVTASFASWENMGRIPTGECMQDLLEEVRRHRVNIDGNVCTVMITTLVLELDPDLSIMDTLHSILFKSEWASSLSYTIDGLMAP